MTDEPSEQVEKKASKFTTLKAYKTSAQRLKIVAAERKMKMYEILDELIKKL